MGEQWGGVAAEALGRRGGRMLRRRRLRAWIGIFRLLMGVGGGEAGRGVREEEVLLVGIGVRSGGGEGEGARIGRGRGDRGW